jgi:plastocyanin
MSSTSGTIIIPQGAGGAQQANFCPPNATIVIGVNNTVTWADQDTSAPHNIYFTMIPAGASQPATSPTLMSGDSFSVTLTTPGTYHYECQFHPGWMQGVLTVVGGSTTTTTTSTTSTTSTTTTSTTSTTTTSTTGTTTPVTITMPQGAGSGKNFSPSQITVMVGVNNTVTFTDQDSLAPHNVWFTSIPSGATNPNTAAGQSSGYTMLKGLSVTYTLTTPGTYDFECQFHSSWMQGVITVVAGT